MKPCRDTSQDLFSSNRGKHDFIQSLRSHTLCTSYSLLTVWALKVFSATGSSLLHLCMGHFARMCVSAGVVQDVYTSVLILHHYYTTCRGCIDSLRKRMLRRYVSQRRTVGRNMVSSFFSHALPLGLSPLVEDSTATSTVSRCHCFSSACCSLVTNCDSGDH